MIQEEPSYTVPAPRPADAGPRRRIRPLLFWTALLGAVTLLFYFFDPASAGLFWTCPFNKLTGLYCPGCGGQRAVHALLHLDFAAALHLNPFVVLVFAPLAAYLYAAFALRALGIAQLQSIDPRAWWVKTLLALLVLFGIWRNIWGPVL